MGTDFVRIPADAGGKRIRHLSLTDITMATELVQAQIGESVQGQTSNATGTIAGIIRKGETIYYLSNVEGTFQDSENLVFNGVTYGQILSATPAVYTPSTHVADPDQPRYIQKVDKRGAAYATFPEGTPQFDSFGRMQMSQMAALGEYYFNQEDQPGKYWTDTVNGGVVEHEVQTSMLVLRTPTTAGARAKRTTNQYHPYKVGTSQLVYIVATVGDQGKQNLKREWGYFDSYNGLGFRLEGTQLQVFMRTDIDGTVQENVVNQANWSEQTLETLITSDFVIDVSKRNIYWMDMAWAGRVRLGVVTPDGRRITCHVFQNANNGNFMPFRSMNLPIRWCQENTGTVGSISEMRIGTSVVFNESADFRFSGTLIHTSPAAPISFTDSNNYVPFLSFRPKLTINGRPNRIIGFHETFDWCSMGDALHVGIFVNPGLTGPDWRSDYIPSTMLETDIAATAMGQDAKPIESFIAGPNMTERVNLGDRIEKSFGLPADGVSQPEFVFAAKLLKPGGSGSLFYTKYWKEVR